MPGARSAAADDGGGPASDLPPAHAKGPHIEVALVAEHGTLRPGATTQLGLRMRMDRHWHVYWGLNTGDSGEPPWIVFEVLDDLKGVEIGEIRWPAPRRYRQAGLVSYVYEGEIVLPIPLRISEDFQGDRIRLAADVGWLVCEENCIPGEARLGIELPVVSAEVPARDPRHAALFDRAEAAMPRAIPDASAQVTQDDAHWLVRLGDGPYGGIDTTLAPEVAPAGWREMSGVLDGTVKARGDDGYLLRLPKHPLMTDAPERLRFVLWTGAFPDQRAWWIDAPVQAAMPATPPKSFQDTGLAKVEAPANAGTPEPALGAAPAVSVEGDHEIPWRTLDDARALLGLPAGSAEAAATDDAIGLWTAILFALLGGLILNLMPCVLPVLSLKILGFVEQAGNDPVRVRRHGYAFAAGVVASFLALAAILLGLKSGGWGFQFQEPLFVVGMILLMFFFGLNLMGVFEVGTGVMNMAGRAEGKVKKGTYVGSFGSGILATLIATPCTAPFMGAALGFALTSSNAVALSVFAALGIGMALPYVMLSMKPSWLQRLPRPGPWMITLRQIFAFPMFGVAIWLTWVLSRQNGSGSLIAVLVSLLILSLGAWLWGRYAHAVSRPRTRRVFGQVLPVLLLGLAIGGAIDAANASPPEKDEARIDARTVPVGEWVPWSPRLVRELRALERPVFVDYTADWCLTCKANEAALDASDAFAATVKEHGVAFLKADWTSRNEAIAAALAWYEQPSVPIYIVHPPAAVADQVPAIRVGPVITPGMVRDAIEVSMQLAERAKAGR